MQYVPRAKHFHIHNDFLFGSFRLVRLSNDFSYDTLFFLLFYSLIFARTYANIAMHVIHGMSQRDQREEMKNGTNTYYEHLCLQRSWYDYKILGCRNNNVDSYVFRMAWIISFFAKIPPKHLLYKHSMCSIREYCSVYVHLRRQPATGNDAAFENQNRWEKSKTNAQQHIHICISTYIYETISFHSVASHFVSTMNRKKFYWNYEFNGKNIQNSKVYALHCTLHTAHIVMKPTCDLSIKIVLVAFFFIYEFFRT